MQNGRSLFLHKFKQLQISQSSQEKNTSTFLTGRLRSIYFDSDTRFRLAKHLYLYITFVPLECDYYLFKVELLAML